MCLLQEQDLSWEKHFLYAARAELLVMFIWLCLCLSADMCTCLLQEQRLSWEKHSFTLRTQPDESLSVADEEPFDITGGREDRLALCKPPKVCRHY